MLFLLFVIVHVGVGVDLVVRVVLMAGLVVPLCGCWGARLLLWLYVFVSVVSNKAVLQIGWLYVFVYIALFLFVSAVFWCYTIHILTNSFFI